MVERLAQHWDTVYGSRSTTELSWHEEHPAASLRLLSEAASSQGTFVDVGAGASSLADELLAGGWTDVTVLDVSAKALEIVRSRLHAQVSYVVADLLTWRPDRQYDAWHDRAAFHFLTAEDERRQYVATAAGADRAGGILVVGTFAADGPKQCSGLSTTRYDEAGLAEVFAPAFAVLHSERGEHTTPTGVVQPFTWGVLRRVP